MAPFYSNHCGPKFTPGNVSLGFKQKVGILFMMKNNVCRCTKALFESICKLFQWLWMCWSSNRWSVALNWAYILFNPKLSSLSRLRRFRSVSMLQNHRMDVFPRQEIKYFHQNQRCLSHKLLVPRFDYLLTPLVLPASL